MHITQAKETRHTLAVMVDNEPGILARIAGLFTARGYNIESLTVSDVTADKAVSRITIVTSASDATTTSFVFEVTGGREKIDTFVTLMREVGLCEVARTGIVAMARGAKAV